MAFGKIVSHIGNGLYSVTIEVDTTTSDNLKNRLQFKLQYIEQNIESAESDLADLEQELFIIEGEVLTNIPIMEEALELLNESLFDYNTQLTVLNRELQVLKDTEASEEDIAAKEAEIAAKRTQIQGKASEITAKEKEIATELGRAGKKQAEIDGKQEQLDFMGIEKLSLEKKIEQVDELGYPTITSPQNIWCVDLSEELAGDIALLEVMTDVDEQLNIFPGFLGVVAPTIADHGTITSFYSLPVSDALRNFLMYPAIQKWKPSFRYGTLGVVDYGSNTCTVYLDFNRSRIQDLGVNQAETLTAVPIEYMQCKAGAFEEGDKVVVQFTDHNQSTPKVIGFQTNPKPCGWEEPWDGPDMNSRHTWTPYHYSTVWSGFSGMEPGPDVSDFMTTNISNGKIHFVQGTIPGYISGGGRYWAEVFWFWQHSNPLADYIEENCKMVVVNANGEIDCSSGRQFSDEYYFALRGTNKANGKIVTLVLYNTYTALSPYNHGCTNIPPEEHDWVLRYTDGDTEAWWKFILNDNGGGIAFPSNMLLDVDTVEVGYARDYYASGSTWTEYNQVDIPASEYVIDLLSLS